MGPPGAAPTAQQNPPGPGAGGEPYLPLLPCRFPGWELGKNFYFSSFKQARFSKLLGYHPGTAGSAPRLSLPSDPWAYIQTKPQTLEDGNRV